MSQLIYDLTTELISSRVNFILWVEGWDKYKPSGKLTWTPVKFSKGNKKKVPAKKGIYAFVVIPGLENISSNGYLFYIGIAGHKSKNTLQERFGQYLSEQSAMKRSGIYYLLNRYKNYLHFAYATPHHKKDLKKIETALLDVYQPPYNSNDFSAHVKRARAALI